MPAKMRKISLWFIAFSLCLLLPAASFAAPCYGTNLPEKKHIFMGLESHSLFKRHLEDNLGTVRSTQQFLLLSYGVFDWLSIDLKGGGGNIMQRPGDRSEIDYAYNFAGGYGLLVKFFDRKNIRAVFGFQHISVHPKDTEAGGVKNQAILDDWQTSLLVSYDFKIVAPYIGTRWSRIDYIHKVGEDRKRVMSQKNKSYGLIFGLDIPLTPKIWCNIEGQFLDSQASAFSINYKF